MKTLVWAMVSAIIGAVLGGFLALGFGTSIGVASGLIQGTQIGICVAAETAAGRELLRDSQVNRLIDAATTMARAKTKGLPAEGEIVWVTDRAGCAELISKLEPSTTVTDEPTE